MKKLLNIARKDLFTTFRDPAALVLLLVTPFALTLAMAFAFGGLTGGSTGLSQIPVSIVNRDPGEFGAYLVQTFQSPDLADLVAATVLEDEAAARAGVDADQAAAVVIIPADFSTSIVPAAGAGSAAGQAPRRTQSVVEVYGNPTRPISAGIVRSIVDRFLSQVSAGTAGGQVAVTQLLLSGLISPQDAAALGREIGERASGQAAGEQAITVESEAAAEQEASGGFDWVTYMAPSMAIIFVMFTATAGARSLLAERDDGTLPRMLTTPTSAGQVIGGKVLGTYLTGLAQVAILIVVSALLFGVQWGDPLGVALLVVVLVAGATAWGMAVAAYSRTPAQANVIGTALTLVFAGVAGNFVPRQLMPSWLQTLSYVSPNAWGLEGFIELNAGGSVADVLLPIVALLAMAAVLFGVAVVAFKRQYA